MVLLLYYGRLRYSVATQREDKRPQQCSVKQLAPASTNIMGGCCQASTAMLGKAIGARMSTSFATPERKGEDAAASPTTVFDLGECKREDAAASPTTVFDLGECNGDIDNLSDLPMLDADAMLQAISNRFRRGEIHTWVWEILLVVNPFEHLPLCSPVSF